MVTNTELQLLASGAQALFALGLLVATGFYTYYTRQQSEATNDQIDAMSVQTQAVTGQTKAMAMPYLKATIEHPNFAEYFFIIQNTGNGAAHDVTAEWEIGADGPDRSWNIPLIAPGESHQFIITKDGDSPVTTADKIDEALEDRGYDLRFEADCEDIFEEEHHFEQEIDIQRAVHGRKERSYEWVETPPEEKMADSIDSISDHVRDVGRLASDLKFDARGMLRSHQKDKHLERIQEFGELTVEQLARLSFKNEHVLRQELMLLAEQELVEFDEEADSVTLAAEE